MKKKVLFVITKSTWGGAGRYVFDLAVALSPRYDVAVALGGNGALVSTLRDAGIRTILIPSLGRDLNARNDRSAFFELLATFKKEKPDIVHLNSSKAGGLGALAGRVAGVPHIVYTAHGWAFNEPVSVFSKFFRWSMSLATLLLSHHVITVSHFDEIHSPLGLGVTTVHNGLSDRVFKTREEAQEYLLTKAHIPKDSFIIGTIAELHTNKGLDILIRAFANTADSELVIIGEGEEGANLERLIAHYGLEKRVHLLGFIDNAARLLKAFDIFVLPSRKEGLPYVILEAGEAGVAVIATMVGGVPEIINDQLSGVLVPAYDARALTEALNELKESPSTRTRYAEALKEKVAREFSLEGMIAKTIEVYES